MTRALTATQTMSAAGVLVGAQVSGQVILASEWRYHDRKVGGCLCHLREKAVGLVLFVVHLDKSRSELWIESRTSKTRSGKAC